jgi:hypothetical protein
LRAHSRYRHLRLRKACCYWIQQLVSHQVAITRKQPYPCFGSKRA